MAEGLETALSLKEAHLTGKIVASLGIHNISNYQGPEKEIILCADNDEHKPHSKTHMVIEKAQEHFATHGHSVTILKPTHPGDDLNDVLKKQGIQGVQAYVKPYLNPHRQDLSQPQPSRTSYHNHGLTETKNEALRTHSSQPTNPPSNIEIISAYLREQFRKMKAFEGSSIADDARREIKKHMEMIHKTTLQQIKDHDPNLAKELQRLEKTQEMTREIMNRGRGMDM